MKQRVVFAVLMSLLLSSLMTCWVTWIHLGINPYFLSQWLTAFLSAWPAAAVIAFFSGPEVHRLSVRLSQNSK